MKATSQSLRRTRVPRSGPRCRRRPERRGAACVELAIVAPLFVMAALGTVEATRMFEIQNQLAMASRSAIRTASMERHGLITSGQTTNGKIIQDVRNFLTSNDLAGNTARIAIVDPADHTTTLDLDDPTNDLKLFELKIELDVGNLAGFTRNLTLSHSLVFRNARATVIP